MNSGILFSNENRFIFFANQSLITFYIFESQVKKNAEIKRFLLPLLKLFVFYLIYVIVLKKQEIHYG